MACEKQHVAQLPDDMVMEILSCLPAKSIGRFRSASSSWDAQLLSPSFVELHRRRANNPGQHKLFFIPTDEPSQEYNNHLYFWQPGGGPVKKLMEIQLCGPAPLTKPLHGLVLIRHDGGYDVCNPSTGEFLALPDTRLPLKTIKRAWPEPMRVQLQSEWVTPLATCNEQKKAMFGTGTCKVFTVDHDGGAPEIMLSPDVNIPGSSFEDTEEYPAIGLLEESLVPLGHIEEEMHLLSPRTEAWRDVLKWLPARSVLGMSLVCREWRVATTNFDFIESHLVHANSINVAEVRRGLLRAGGISYHQKRVRGR
ncbi:unnamed protein product [Alopecurus aequalis]